VGTQVEVLRPDELVGRQDELSELSAFLGSAREGFAALVLRGVPGIGKTTLWRLGIAMATDRGLAVLAARPAAAEVTLSFSGLLDLLAGAADGVLAGLPAVQRHAVEVALLRRDAAEGSVNRLALSAGVLSVLRELAKAGPLLLAIDDLQWLDQATASVLGFALRRLEDQRIRLLVCERSASSWPGTTFDERTRSTKTVLDALGPCAYAEVAIAPLSQQDTERLLREKFPKQLLPRAAALAAAASEGNPFYAIEVAREIVRSGEPSSAGALVLPGRLREVLTSELARLPSRTRTALLAASCLAEPTSALVDPAPLAQAEEAGFVKVERDGRIRFTHPLMRAAVYESAPQNRRRAAHRALASRIDDLEERARHLALGAEGPDDEVASKLEEAAKVAYARGSPAAAAELMELALQMGRAGLSPARADRLVRGANFHFQAGDFARAQALVEEALAIAPGGTVRARALRVLAQLSSRRGSFASAVELASEAVEEASNEPVLRAELELDLVFYLTMQSKGPEALAHAGVAVLLAEAAGLDAIVAEGLAVMQMQSFLLGHGLSEEDLLRSLALEDRSRDAPAVLRPRLIASLLRLWTDKPSEAREILEQLYAEAVESGRESDVPGMASYLAWACLWSGDVRRAAELTNEAQCIAERLDDWFLSGTALFVGALARVYTGETERARADSQLALTTFARLQFTAGMTWASWALGLAELSLGNSAGVEAVLGPMSSVLGDLTSVDPIVAVFIPDEVEALIDLGQLDKAQDLAERFERQAQATKRAWALAAAARCQALLLAARGDSAGAIGTLEAALEIHATTELPLELARSLLALGRLQRRRKQKRLAREPLQGAFDLFSEAGATLWAANARSELARVSSPQSASGLTETEASIARLAAEGLANKAIAQRCFVSVKTVEANLTRIYQKLGVTSRTQLARVLEKAST
jgi:DNA-binding NarL/FixJ family response regulator